MFSLLKRASYQVWHLNDFEDKYIKAWLRTATSRALSSGFGGLFSAAAILFIAERLDTDCDERIEIGSATVRISSLLAINSIIENVLMAICSPTFGALADSKYDRKSLLILSAVVWVGLFVITAVSLFFKPSLFIFIFFASSVLVLRIAYELFLVLMFSYLPEVAKTEEQISALSSRNYGIIKGVQLIATIIIALLTVALDNVFLNDIPYTIIAHFMVVAWFCYFGISGIANLPRRKNFESKSFCASFSGIKDAVMEIRREYTHVGLFLLAFTIYFSGVISIIALQISFVVEVFDFGTKDIAILGIISLVSASSGAFSVEYLAKKVKLKTILFGGVLLYGTFTLVLPFVLYAEDIDITNTTQTTASGCLESEVTSKQPTLIAYILLYVFSFVLGYNLGLVYPVNIAIFAQIIPGGKETTYFGLKNLCAEILAWLPPLIFTLINESTENIRLALASVSIFFFLALPFIYCMNVEKGIQDIQHTLKLRRQYLEINTLTLKVSSVDNGDGYHAKTTNPMFHSSHGDFEE